MDMKGIIECSHCYATFYETEEDGKDFLVACEKLHGLGWYEFKDPTGLNGLLPVKVFHNRKIGDFVSRPDFVNVRPFEPIYKDDKKQKPCNKP